MEKVILGNVLIPAWIILPVIFFIWVMALVSLKKIAFALIGRFAARTQTRIDDILIKSCQGPLMLIIFASGGVVIERLAPIFMNFAGDHYFSAIFKAVLIISIIIFAERFLTALVYEYARRVEILKSSGGIVRGFMRVLIIGLGFLVLLDSFGVSVTPILASLGIGSLAVALALQPTLENFFAGIQIVIDKPIQGGHFVKLESGEEGYVHKIGWRSTWVRLLANNMVVIPNKSLQNARIINYYYPDQEIAALVEVGVHYRSDLEMVERITVEVGKEVMQQIPGGVKTFQPFIRYHTFGDSGIHFTVILRAGEFVDQYLIKHEFIKRLQKRYAAEGIVIPYPVRAVNYDQEKETSVKGGS